MKRIPVIIVSGFLGSGKTTLLLKMLMASVKQNLNYAVLINERGKVDIDGLLVEKRFGNEQVESLLDGCICCSKKSEISNSMEALLKKKPDVIFIELTGVADPDEVANTLTEKEIIAKVELKKIITVLDAEYMLSTASVDYQETLLHQIDCADLVVVNKVDLVNRSVKNKITAMIKRRNATAALEFTSFGEINGEKLVKEIFTTNRQQRKIARKPVFSDMTTIVLPIERPLVKDEIEQFLAEQGDAIIRAKGFLPIVEADSQTSYLFQYSGVRRIEWKLYSSEEYYLILIGTDLDSTQLREEWGHVMEKDNHLIRERGNFNPTTKGGKR